MRGDTTNRGQRDHQKACQDIFACTTQCGAIGIRMQTFAVNSDIVRKMHRVFTLCKNIRHIVFEGGVVG